MPVARQPVSDSGSNAATTTVAVERSACVVAHNVRRLMAQAAMTYDDVVAASGLDARTIRGVVRGDNTPRARTLHQLAEGFGVATDELFVPPAGLSAAAFDAATNPAVDRVKESHPEVFDGWTADDFAELASRFGVGGELTDEGAIHEAEQINHKRDVLRRASIVLETPQADLLVQLVDLLYERARIDK